MPPHHLKIVEETPAPLEETPALSEETLDHAENDVEEEKVGEVEVGELEVEEVELEFTICRRPPTIMTEDAEVGEEDNESEDGSDVGTSTTKRTTKRKVRDKKVVPKLPEAPSFDNVFLHPKAAHGGHPNLPSALLLGEALPPLRIFSLFFTYSILSDLATQHI